MKAKVEYDKIPDDDGEELLVSIVRASQQNSCCYFEVTPPGGCPMHIMAVPKSRVTPELAKAFKDIFTEPRTRTVSVDPESN